MKKVDLSGEDFKRAPFPTLTRLVDESPFCETKVPLLGKVTFVTRHGGITAFLKDQESFAVDARNAGKKSPFGMFWLPKSIQIVAENMLSLDEPDHRRLRKLVDLSFRAGAIDKLGPAIERIANTLMDKMEATGERDLLHGFCRPLPLAVICEMLGLPESDRPEFMGWMEGLQGAGTVRTLFTFMPILKKISSYLKAEFERRQHDPQPGLITELVQAEADGEKLSEDELLAMVFLLFFAGHETTTHLFSNSVLALDTHPDALASLKEDWTRAPAAVEELHRFTCPVQMTKPRFVRRDMEFLGQSFKRGDKLMALLAAGNLDPAVFNNPTTLDITREKNRHLGYGGGLHLCLGLHLARAELQIGLQTLYTRWPNLCPVRTPSELSWTKRIGTRGVTSLPIKF
ncbi:MAG: cytochrome P450 [Hyphomonadaceae bacterium]